MPRQMGQKRVHSASDEKKKERFDCTQERVLFRFVERNGTSHVRQ